MQRPVQLRDSPSENEGKDDSGSDAEGNTSSQSETGGSEGTDSSFDSDDGQGDSSNANDEFAATEASIALKSVSFGALVEAQHNLQPTPRKRKLPLDFEVNNQDTTEQIEPWKREHTEASRVKVTRQSKHAPTISSSRQQVSRRREIFESSAAAKSRDPRFDATIQSSTHAQSAIDKANKNYSFLNMYQAAEILELKSQIKKTKDPEAVADLKQRVMAIENKVRAVEAKQRERDVVKQHKQKEKEMIRTGQKSKPYYLGDSQVRKLAEKERLDRLGKKARDKALLRKSKREKGKASKDMPRVRRE